jgi:hypothetical protein
MSDGIQGNVFYFITPPKIIFFSENDCSELTYTSNLVTLKKKTEGRSFKASSN